ncbi:MAG: PAS domain S-box protein [Chloroflexota bacterium]
MIGSVQVAHDITERKRAEEELIRLNKALKALSDSSQALIGTKDDLDYLNDVCRIVIEDCGYSMVWIGFAENDEAKSVRPVAHAGFEDGYLETLHITWADTERGHGPTGMAIRTGKVTTCRNMLTDAAFTPWREQAIRRGYSSSIVFPLIADGKAFGAITIYSKEPDPFSEGEVKLLTELSDNLSYGIQVIRIRAAQRRAEEALRRSEGKYRALVETSLIPAMIVQDGKLRFASSSLSQVIGYSQGELLAFSAEEIAALIHPEDRSRVLKNAGDRIAGRAAPSRYEFRVFHKDGHVRWIEVAPSIIDYEGKPAAQTPVIDITDRKRDDEALRRSRAALEDRVKERTKELADSEERLRNLYANLQSLRETERTNIARDIHDDLGQTLTALKMDLSWIAARLPADDNAMLKKKLDADLDEVDKTIQVVKRVCTELRPGILDHLGLSAAIEWQAAEFQERTRIKCEVVCEHEDIAVDADLSTPLFRIFQEALTNVETCKGN